MNEKILTLCTAIKNSDLGQVRRALNTDSDLRKAVQAKTAYDSKAREESPIHTACDLGHPDIVSLLAKDYALPVNCRHNTKQEIWSCTPLHVSVKKDRVECARILLEVGANVDEFDVFPGFWSTALHSAAVRGNEEMVKLLIKHGANHAAEGEWNHKKYKGTPSQWAIQKGHLTLASLIEAEVIQREVRKTVEEKCTLIQKELDDQIEKVSELERKLKEAQDQAQERNRLAKKLDKKDRKLQKMAQKLTVQCHQSIQGEETPPNTNCVYKNFRNPFVVILDFVGYRESHPDQPPSLFFEKDIEKITGTMRQRTAVVYRPEDETQLKDTISNVLEELKHYDGLLMFILGMEKKHF